MVAFLGFTMAVILVLWLAPDSPTGRALHRQLVEYPLEALSSLRLSHLIFIAIMSGFMLAGGEILFVAGPGLVTGFALELAIYLDAVLVTLVLSAMAQIRFGCSRIRTLALRPLRRMRARTKRAARRGARPRKPANDDDEPAPALLAA